jgi:hypothetical protein
MPHQWIEAPVDPKIHHPLIGKKRWKCTACGKYVGYKTGTIPPPDDHVWVSLDGKDVRNAVRMTCEEYQIWRVQSQ